MPSRPPFRLTVFVCCAASIGFSAVLGAHDTWLLANRGNVPVGGTITLDMSSGGRFPASETAILPARVAQAQWRLAGASHPLQTVGRQAGALRFRATLTAGGVAPLWVSLHPKVLTLKPSLVQEYTSEIGAPPEIFEGWQRATDKTWRERYSKHAKSFVRVGTSAATDTSWRMRTGQSYELVPVQNPTALAAGDTLDVLALRCGQLQANIAIGVQSAATGHGALVKTDASGKARVTIARSGRWLVTSTSLSRADRAGSVCEPPVAGDTVTVGYVSEFATMTLDVARRAK